MNTLRERVCMLIFLVHFVLWIPMTALGIMLLGFRIAFVSRWMDVSGTALAILNGRWILSTFGLREDDSARNLARVLPNNSPLAARLLCAPFYLHYRLTGTSIYPEFSAPGQEELKHIIANRSLYFDTLIQRHSENIRQFVILGAGFDTRFYGTNTNNKLNSALSGKKLFELDMPNTQQMKRKYLPKAGILGDHVTYVEVNFASPECDWPAQLRRAGFDSNLPALFLWEGVTLYITRMEVIATMKRISNVAAPGSVLLADIYGTKFQPMLDARFRAFLRTTHEEIQFLMNFKNDARAEIKIFVKEQGMQLGDTHVMGGKTKLGEWMAVAEVLA